MIRSSDWIPDKACGLSGMTFLCPFRFPKSGICFRKNHIFIPFILGLLWLLTASLVMAGERAPEITPPFQPGDSRHGYADFETLPDVPSELPADSHQHVPLSQQPLSPDDRPRGLFQNITTAKSFDVGLEFRRGHYYRPIEPTDVFRTEALAVYVVFRVFEHYAPYQIIGRVYPESVSGLDRDVWFDEDVVSLAPEDESGYLKLFPPKEGWLPGQYRVDIYVGYEVNPNNRMGSLRFTMQSADGK